MRPGQPERCPASVDQPTTRADSRQRVWSVINGDAIVVDGTDSERHEITDPRADLDGRLAVTIDLNGPRVDLKRIEECRRDGFGVPLVEGNGVLVDGPLGDGGRECRKEVLEEAGNPAPQLGLQPTIDDRRREIRLAVPFRRNARNSRIASYGKGDSSGSRWGLRAQNQGPRRQNPGLSSIPGYCTAGRRYRRRRDDGEPPPRR